MTDVLATTYPAHIATMRQRADAALAKAGRDHLVVPAGAVRNKFRDDLSYPFVVSPHFKAWLPVLRAPGSWLVYTPGAKPKLIYLQPRDYWHVVPEAPQGYWVEQFDIVIIRNADEARAELPADAARCAVLGEAASAVGDMAPDNPQALVDDLHYQRAWKTDYELECMRRANRVGVAGHRAAEMAFRSGESEFGIHMAYLHASNQTEAELPYGSIIALNAHGAVLHYMDFGRAAPAHCDSFLIDAGGSFNGYASDITRAYAAPEAAEFQALIDAMDAGQRDLCAKVRDGQSYPDLHIEAHHMVAGILREHGIIDMGVDAAVETGVTSTFFPHGLGHLIGLQVHDVGGFMAGADGGRIEPPDGHPFLRLTRPLSAGMVVTIEPGLYFIGMLLDELKAKPQASHVDWAKVDALRKFGGIRIEDDVACTDGEPENLTRDAFAA